MIFPTTEVLDRLVESGECHESDTAMAILGCSEAMLAELARSGSLDAIFMGGRAVVTVESAKALAWARLSERHEKKSITAARYSTLLNKYVSARGVTGDGEEAARTGTPLLTNRKGKPSTHRRFGPDFHAVVLNCELLHEFALAEGEANQDPVPAMGQFFDDMTQLAGVTGTTWATPLFGGEPVRLRRGLRIALAQRPVELPARLLAHVSTPPGERHLLDDEPAGPDDVVDPYEAERGMYGDAYVEEKLAAGERP